MSTRKKPQHLSDRLRHSNEYGSRDNSMTDTDFLEFLSLVHKLLNVLVVEAVTSVYPHSQPGSERS